MRAEREGALDYVMCCAVARRLVLLTDKDPAEILFGVEASIDDGDRRRECRLPGPVTVATKAIETGAVRGRPPVSSLLDLEGMIRGTRMVNG